LTERAQSFKTAFRQLRHGKKWDKALAQRFLLVCTVKDEGPNILEWVAYHRAIGFTDIAVFENNSFDLTDRALKSLDQIGAITFTPNSFSHHHVKPPYQNRAYRRAARLEAYREGDWCIALDGDEFLQVNVGEGRVSDLVDALPPGVDEVRLNWRIFGSNHLRELDDRLVTERFTMAGDKAEVLKELIPVKTMFRPQHFARPGIHLPRVPNIEQPVIVTGSGIPIEQANSRGFRCTDPGQYALAQVNHYMVRDADSFLIKSARGSSSHPDRAIRLNYWKNGNRNADVETAAADRSEAVWAEMRRLDEASGGRLLGMRARSLRFWRKRLEKLKSRADFQELYAALV
jgi:hypothetical protein